MWISRKKYAKVLEEARKDGYAVGEVAAQDSIHSAVFKLEKKIEQKNSDVIAAIANNNVIMEKSIFDLSDKIEALNVDQLLERIDDFANGIIEIESKIDANSSKLCDMDTRQLDILNDINKIRNTVISQVSAVDISLTELINNTAEIDRNSKDILTISENSDIDSLAKEKTVDELADHVDIQVDNIIDRLDDTTAKIVEQVLKLQEKKPAVKKKPAAKKKSVAKATDTKKTSTKNK